MHKSLCTFSDVSSCFCAVTRLTNAFCYATKIAHINASTFNLMNVVKGTNKI